jgi:hypothetical protein
MKTLVKVCLAASVLALGACAHHDDNGGAKMQSYDQQAPYSQERTAGSDTTTTTAPVSQGDHMYNTHQNK